jgi:hypothetical protein
LLSFYDAIFVFRLLVTVILVFVMFRILVLFAHSARRIDEQTDQSESKARRAQEDGRLAALRPGAALWRRH